jgi:TRAP-type C4-dicarboxylate transport system permease small subunit
MRYLFNAPTDWAFEFTILLCGICYLLAGGYVTQKDVHIAITSVFDLAPPPVRRGLRIFATLVGIFASAGLLWSASGPALRAATIVERTGSAWNSPAPAIIKPVIALAALLVLLQLLVRLHGQLRGREL